MRWVGQAWQGSLMSSFWRLLCGRAREYRRSVPSGSSKRGDCPGERKSSVLPWGHEADGPNCPEWEQSRVESTRRLRIRDCCTLTVEESKSRRTLGEHSERENERTRERENERTKEQGNERTRERKNKRARERDREAESTREQEHESTKARESTRAREHERAQERESTVEAAHKNSVQARVG